MLTLKNPSKFLVGLILILSSCGPEKPPVMPPLEFPVVEVIQMDVPLVVDFVGQTYGNSDIAIRARVDGFLEGIHFEEGRGVKKGQLLYTIDPEQFEAKVASSQSGLAEAKTRLVLAVNELNRIKPLAEMNAVSKSDLDGAIAEKEAAEASVEAAEAELRYSKITLSYTRIHSPIEGLIGITEAQVGDYVGRYPNPVVLNTVSDIDIILVRFSVAESAYLRFVRYAQKRGARNREERAKTANLQLILADGSIHGQKGKVDFANRQVDASTGTLLLQASFPNPGDVIRPGQFARIRAIIDIIEGGILVPQRSVKEIQGVYQVFVVNDGGEIETRTIDLGPQIGNMWVVKEGVAKGDKVLLEGIQRARSGMKISPKIQEFEIIEQE